MQQRPPKPLRSYLQLPEADRNRVSSTALFLDNTKKVLDVHSLGGHHRHGSSQRHAHHEICKGSGS